MKTNGFVYISVPDNITYAIKVTNDILDFSTNTLDKSPTDIQGCKTFDAGGGVLYLVVLEVIIQQLVCILETNANIVLL